MTATADRHVLHRAARIEARDAGATGREYPISVSSEEPVLRYDYATGRYFNEILVHTAQAIDLSRASRGLPVVEDHEPTMRNTVGRALNLAIRMDRKLAGTLRLTNNPRGAEIAADIDAEIVGDASIGYEVLDYTDTPGRDDTEPFTRTVTSWRPYEVTLTPIPADLTVGANRAAPSLPKKTQEIQVIDTPPEQSREAAIRSMCMGADVTVGRMQALIDSGKSLQQVSTELMADLAKRSVSRATPVDFSDLEGADAPKVSLLEGLRSLHPDYEGDMGAIREHQQEMARRGFEAKRGGFVAPDLLGLHKRALAGTATKGAESLFMIPGRTLDMLRPISRMEELGIEIHPGQSSNVGYVDVTGGVTVTWTGENPGSPAPQTDQTMSLRSTSAKTAIASTQVSRNFIRQSSDADLAIRDLRAAVAAEIERVVYYGSGTSNQPAGIGIQAGTNLIAMGANGAQPTLDKIIEGIAAICAANCEIENVRVVMTPEVALRAANIPRFANTDSRTLWDLDTGKVLGRDAFMSNNLPKTLTKGTSSGVAHAGIIGDFSAAHLFEFGATEIVADPYTQARQGLINLTTFSLVDVLLTRPSWFAVYRDLLK